MALRFDFTGNLEAATTLPDGSLRIPARIARSGTQSYLHDGKPVVEYRDPDEVFSDQAIESFKHAAVTVGHVGTVSPKTFKSMAVGYVAEDVRRDGEFLAASLIVRDEDTISRILSRELVELSGGYRCKVLEEGGEHNGQRYDRKQTDIVGNHVALLPRGKGRAGPEVCLRLDAHDDAVPPSSYDTDMELTEALAALKKLTERTDALEKDAAEAKRLAAAADESAKAEKVRADAASEELSKVKSAAIKTKAGTLTDKTDGSDRDVMVKAIQTVRPDYRADGKSDLQVAEAFELALEDKAKTEAQKLADAASRTDAKDKEPSAREKMLAEYKTAWTSGGSK